MDAKEIMSRKFEMVLRGYKTEEVDEYLREVSLNFSRQKKDNEDLEKKLEVLAQKIREYREDEDALKDAMLGAQRQANALIADSKRKAAEIIEETENKRDEMLKKAEDDRQKLQEKGEKQIADAEEEARIIIENARKAAADIENEMNLRTDVQKEILHRTSNEISEFKTRITDSYKRHMEAIEKVVEVCENKFIKETLANYKGEPVLKVYKPEKHEPQKVKKQTTALPVAVPVANENTENDAKKFELNMNDENVSDADEAVVSSEEGFVTEYLDEFAEETNTAETGEIPVFKSNDDNKKTSEVFFKKSKQKRG